MTQQWQRVSVIFRKELLETVRDHRTLIAMVAVPVLLYPLLLIGMAHAFRATTVNLQKESYTVGVPSATDVEWLEAVIARDLERFKNKAPIPASQREKAGRNVRRVTRPDHLKVSVVTGDPASRIADREIHAFIESDAGPGDFFAADKPTTVTITYDRAEIRSEMAAAVLQEMLHREAYHLLLRHLENGRDTNVGMAEPIVITGKSVATAEKMGGSALGTIVPLLLVLMTLTGAIYPAIDLTAGERERGTLETLLAAPTAPTYLVAGKFLVVSTIAMVTALLNLTSLAFTIQVSGVSGMIAGQQNATIPLSVFPLIMLSMVPFAVLSSAILLAVASFARTFKEAQNYVAPVMMAVLVPAAAGTIPGVELSPGMAVTPVLNVTLLTRELLLGHFDWLLIALVLASTSLYAAAAVAVAGRIFGTEAVMFADSRSLLAIWRRRNIPPGQDVSISLALALAAVAFVVVFHGHQACERLFSGGAARAVGIRFGGISCVSLMAFVGLPVAATWYAKINRACLRPRAPRMGSVVGAGLIGLGSWAIAMQIGLHQPIDEQMKEQMELLGKHLGVLPLPALLVILAVVPALAEEFFFRGVVQGAVERSTSPLRAILLSSLAFALFHFSIDKLLVTFLMGVVLGWVCWRSGSIWPGVLLHLGHNGVSTLASFYGPLTKALGLTGVEETKWVPVPVLAGAAALVVLGIATVRFSRRTALLGAGKGGATGR